MKTDYPRRHEELQGLLRQFGLQAPDVAAAHEQLRGAALNDGAVSARNKHLIALGIAIVAGGDAAVVAATRAALVSGATPEEIIDCIAVARFMGGELAALRATEGLAALQGFSMSEQCLLGQLERQPRTPSS